MKTIILILMLSGYGFSGDNHYMDDFIEDIIVLRVESNRISEIKKFSAFKASVANQIYIIFETMETQAKIIKKMKKEEKERANSPLARLIDFADEGALLGIILAWQGQKHVRRKRRDKKNGLNDTIS